MTRKAKKYQIFVRQIGPDGVGPEVLFEEHATKLEAERRYHAILDAHSSDPWGRRTMFVSIREA